MTNYKFQTSIKLVLLVFALSMAFSVLWINSTIISNLREGNRRQIEKIAEFYSELLSENETNDNELNDEELQYAVEILIPILNNFEFPIIITTNLEVDEISYGDIYAVSNVGLSYEKNTEQYIRQIKDMVRQMDSNFIPYNITALDSNGNKTVLLKIHYGDQKIIKTISMLPYLNFGFAILFISISAFGIQLIRTNERNSIYAGMARETAHQLGTPISSLLGWVELLKDKMLADKRNKILSSMKSDLARLSEISDRFSKIGSRVNLKKVNLKSLLENVTMYMSNRLPKSSSINILLSVEKNITIMGDSVLLSWAFENIIKNSIDAISSKKGEIIIKLMEENDEISLLFSDNGKGIKRNDWKNIFRPGFSTKKRGWGLGLSLTQRIVRDIHKGKIIVIDSSSSGTHIKINLPFS
tara:strand:+ start:1084 stop:2322 length:1239 start_codon:yes stop_codon:yes gene_type:complete